MRKAWVVYSPCQDCGSEHHATEGHVQGGNNKPDSFMLYNEVQQALMAQARLHTMEEVKPAMHDPIVWVAWQRVEYSASVLEEWLDEIDQINAVPLGVVPKWHEVCLERVAGWSERLTAEVEQASRFTREAVKQGRYCMPAHPINHWAFVLDFLRDK